jgi:pimeloyl-ACP methyl ester carboxylesterase
VEFVIVRRLVFAPIGVVLVAALSVGCSSGSPKTAAGSTSASPTVAASSTVAASPSAVASTPSPAASASPASQTAAASSAAPSPSASAANCDGVAYRQIAASDGTQLGVVERGTGPRGVLMLPQYQSSACYWNDEASHLVDGGYHVLMLEYRCTDNSACPADGAAQSQLPLDVAAGVAALHTAGAAKVVILGASAGGTLAVVAGAAAGPLVNGVIDLSGPADVSDLYNAGTGVMDSGAAAPKLHVPALFVVSNNDPSTSVSEITSVYKSVPGTHKKLLVLSPDGGHGWDTLNYNGPPGNVQGEVDNFLAAND